MEEKKKTTLFESALLVSKEPEIELSYSFLMPVEEWRKLKLEEQYELLRKVRELNNSIFAKVREVVKW
jgi:hypothetical protein